MEIVANGNHWLLILTLTVPRFLAIFLMLPFFGNQFISTTVRNAIAISLAIIILPIVSQQVLSFPFDSMAYIGLIVKEAILGIIIGYLVGIIFWSIASTGVIIDMQRGAMAAQMFNPVVGSQTSPLGSFFAQTAATLFLVSGGFLVLLSAIYKSYMLWPVTSYFPEFHAEAAGLFLKQFDFLTYTALLLAAPAVILMFITELGVGLIGRFVPSINVFLLAMPLKSILVFIVLSIYMSTIIYYLKGHFLSFETLVEMISVVFK